MCECVCVTFIHDSKYTYANMCVCVCVCVWNNMCVRTFIYVFTEHFLYKQNSVHGKLYAKSRMFEFRIVFLQN